MNPKSFVKFDRVVSRAVGRWSQSFLDAISELANDEEDGAYVETVCELADENVVENVEGVDSSNKDEVTVVDSVVTPTSKALGKMVVCELANQNLAEKIHGADSTDKDDVAIVD